MHNRPRVSEGVQCRRQNGTKHSLRQYEAREQDLKVPMIGYSERKRGGGLRSRLHC